MKFLCRNQKRTNGDSRTKSLKELISAMEQLYSGLLSVETAVVGEPHYYTLELAVPEDSAELQFYAAIPNGKRNLFEKQLLAIFPNAYLEQKPYDYNVFASTGVALVSEAHFAENPALPLKGLYRF